MYFGSSRQNVSAASLGSKYLRCVNAIAPASTWMVRYATSSKMFCHTYLDKMDVMHIERILTKGCPSSINFEVASDMKSFIMKKGNQATFKMYPEKVTKTMNKEVKHSHLLPVKLWVLNFSLWCHHTTQGILVKPGKNLQVIF